MEPTQTLEKMRYKNGADCGTRTHEDFRRLLTKQLQLPLCETGLKKNIHNYERILYFVKLKMNQVDVRCICQFPHRSNQPQTY